MKMLPVAVAAVTVLLAATGCGGPPETAAATDQEAQAGRQPEDRRTTGGAEPPGASGEIAAVDGRTLQVQHPMAGQVAVTYTDDTAITAQVPAAAADLEVGDCVAVSGEGEGTVAATSVLVSPRMDGSCVPLMLGGGPGRRIDAGQPREGARADRPGGAPDRRVTSGVFGEVTAAEEDGFTVEVTAPGDTGRITKEVTTSPATTWTVTVDATSDALKVGRCVVARGTKDDTGSVTATGITVSEKVDGECGPGGLRAFAGRPS